MTGAQRTEGWGIGHTGGGIHYFYRSGRLIGRSLCDLSTDYWPPTWVERQARGSQPNSGVCRACWRKAPEVAP